MDGRGIIDLIVMKVSSFYSGSEAKSTKYEANMFKH